MTYLPLTPFLHKVMTLIERVRTKQLFRYRRPSKAEFLARKKPSEEVYDQLAPLTGRDLLNVEPVKRLTGYANDWEPFIVASDPVASPEARALVVNPDTGAIALPHPFVTPTRKEAGKRSQWPKKQFYWDMYFINKGLLATGDPRFIEIAKGHIENFEFLFERLRFIPNASDISLTSRSQIPFLTGMIIDIYNVTGDKEWLQQKMDFAKKEYNEWMATQGELEKAGSARVSHRISSDSLLLRAVGRDIEKDHYAAAALTGEDDSAEWARRAYEYVPVSLNSAMYQYESDFAKMADILGDRTGNELWEGRAKQRAGEMNAMLWDKPSGRFVNAMLDRETKQWVRDTQYQGLSSFMPLWIGIATKEQADAMVRTLPQFEAPYGLMIATKESSPSTAWVRRRLRAALLGKWKRYVPAAMDMFAPQQWDYPNVWAPMEYFATQGLIRYGKYDEAKRVMETSLKGLAAFFAEHGTLPEKHNGLTGRNGENYNYPNQEGFGWVNAWVQYVYATLDQMDRQGMVKSPHEPRLSA